MSHGFKFVLGDFYGNSWAGCAKAVHNHNSVVPALIGDRLFCFVSLSLLCCLEIFLMIFCFFCHFFWCRSLGILSLRTLFFCWQSGFVFAFWKFSLLISAFFNGLFFLGLFSSLFFSFVGPCGVVVYGIVCLIWFLESFFFLFWNRLAAHPLPLMPTIWPYLACLLHGENRGSYAVREFGKI